MSFWVYKCNDTNHPIQVVHGDWNYIFSRSKQSQWGSTKFIPDIIKLSIGDLLVAYQTERNEVVGLAEVMQLKSEGSVKELHVRPIEEYRVKLLPLKTLDERIRDLKIFARGNIATIYPITTSDAWHLLNVVKAQSRLQQVVSPPLKKKKTK